MHDQACTAIQIQLPTMLMGQRFSKNPSEIFTSWCFSAWQTQKLSFITIACQAGMAIAF
jgi:hypothetical protein